MKYILMFFLMINMAFADILVQPRVGLPNEQAVVASQGKVKKHLSEINVYLIEGNDASKIKNDKRFQFAEVDQAVPHDLIPSDPAYSQSWALPKIGAPAAWDSALGNGVIVAVLDSGVLLSHPDLRILDGYNFYDNNTDYNDYTGHGTKVIGTINMQMNNGVGSAGVAPGADIFALRISDLNTYGYYSTMSSALIWAADRGARVANISYANVFSSSTVASAAQYMQNKTQGLVFVSAGNGGALIDSPQSPATVAVSATDSNDVRPSWASWGPYVDVAAPGVSIYSTNNTGGYSSVSGTSFSSPITAGLAALVMSANPTLGWKDVEYIIRETTLDIGTVGYDQNYGDGRIQADKAVALALTYVPVDLDAPTVKIVNPVQGAYVSGLVPVDVTATDNVGVVRVELNGMVDTLSPYGFIFDTTGLTGTQTLTAYAYDFVGNVSSHTITVNIGTSAPPTITKFVIDKTKITVAATDDVAVTRTEILVDNVLKASGVTSATYNWRKMPSGTYTVTAKAFDGNGNVTVSNKTYTK